MNKVTGGVVRIRDGKEMNDPILCFENISDVKDWCSDSKVSMELYEVKDISQDPIGIASALTAIASGEITLRKLRPRTS